MRTIEILPLGVLVRFAYSDVLGQLTSATLHADGSVSYRVVYFDNGTHQEVGGLTSVEIEVLDEDASPESVGFREINGRETL